MAENERYLRVRELKRAVYFAGSPVQYEKGAILWDKLQQRTLVQLKYRNLGAQELKSFYIHYVLLDSGDKPIEEKDFSYVDVNCPAGAEFGTKFPIVSTSEFVRDIQISLQKVIWKDGTVFDASVCKIEVETSQQLTEILSPEQFKLMAELRGINEESARGAAVPREQREGIWRCICGAYAKDDRCLACGMEKAAAFRAGDAEQLQKILLEREQKAKEEEKRRQREAIEKEERRRAQEEAAKKQVKKLAKKMKVLIPALCVFGAAVYFMFPTLNQARLKAVDLWWDLTWKIEHAVQYVKETAGCSAEEKKLARRQEEKQCQEHAAFGRADYPNSDYVQLIDDLALRSNGTVDLGIIDDDCRYGNCTCGYCYVLLWEDVEKVFSPRYGVYAAIRKDGKMYYCEAQESGERLKNYYWNSKYEHKLGMDGALYSRIYGDLGWSDEWELLLEDVNDYVDSNAVPIVIMKDGSLQMAAEQKRIPKTYKNINVSDWKKAGNVVQVFALHRDVYVLNDVGEVWLVYSEGSPMMKKMDELNNIVKLEELKECLVAINQNGTVWSSCPEKVDLSDFQNVADIESGIGGTFSLNKDGTITRIYY